MLHIIYLFLYQNPPISSANNNDDAAPGEQTTLAVVRVKLLIFQSSLKQICYMICVVQADGMPQDFDQSSYATGHAGGAPADDGFGKTRNLFHFVFCLIVNGATDHVNYPENVAAATSTSVCWWLLVVKTIYITTIILIYFVCFSVLSSSCSCLWRCLVLIPHRHKTMCGVILAHPHPTPIFF